MADKNPHRWRPRPLDVHEEHDPERQWKCEACQLEAAEKLEGECTQVAFELEAE